LPKELRDHEVAMKLAAELEQSRLASNPPPATNRRSSSLFPCPSDDAQRDGLPSPDPTAATPDPSRPRPAPQPLQRRLWSADQRPALSSLRSATPLPLWGALPLWPHHCAHQHCLPSRGLCPAPAIPCRSHTPQSPALLFLSSLRSPDTTAAEPVLLPTAPTAAPAQQRGWGLPLPPRG
jgi:hypothetical protein